MPVTTSGSSGGRRRHSVDAHDKQECGNAPAEGSTWPTAISPEANTAGALDIDYARIALRPSAATPAILVGSNPPSVNDIAPNPEIEPTSPSRDDLHSTASYANGDRDASQSLPAAGTDSELDLVNRTMSRILKLGVQTRVEFFGKGSNPFRPFHLREARDAYTRPDEFLRDDDYLFVWKIGKVGRVVITLENLEPVLTSVDVRRVLLRFGDDDDQELDFVAGTHFRQQPEIKAYLDASRLNCPRLHVASDSWGEIDEKYVVMTFIIEVATDAQSSYVERLKATVFCKVQANRKTRRLYAKQKMEKQWERAPQEARNTVRGIGKIIKAVPLNAIKSVKCFGCLPG